MIAQDQYKNKLFSILGDSISTLEGYSEPEDTAHYTGLRMFEADVFTPADTWWGQVISHLGGELLVNNSFSGSMVTKHKNCLIPSYGCSDERTSSLDRAGKMPDVIMVYMGTNDRGWGVPPTPDDAAVKEDMAVFSVAYSHMLEKLHKNYPQAEIWCFTLSRCTRRNSAEISIPDYFRGHHMDEYCNVIRACAEAYGCRLIDLCRAAAPYATVDDLHPNAEGMKTLADAVIRQLTFGHL